MNHGLIDASRALALTLGNRLQQHPKRLTALVATLLLCGGGGALAVAGLAPDAAELPVRQILQSVEAPSLAASIEALDVHQFRLYRSETTRSSDTAESLLQRLGVNDPAAAMYLRSDATVRQALFGRAGRSVSAETTDNHGLVTLTARWATGDTDNTFQRLVVRKTASGFAARIETAPLVATSRLASGTIRTSLFAATDDAALPDSVATQIAEIFASDIDFRRELRKGDRFSVVYETLEADGEPLRAGRVLSAEFANGGKTHEAMWFQENGSKGAYYTLAGQSLRKAYLASPLEFSRVTSGFSMRMHPIHKTWRAHLGTDFGAPTGTAVRTVGDGTVEFAGVQNGFGNVVFVKHRNQHVTVYAHLSRINVRVGQSVDQGDTIGAVGATGWATGPHLHFEFRVNGQHQDPLHIAKQSDAVPVSVASRPQFDRLASAMRMQLAAAASVLQASAQ